VSQVIALTLAAGSRGSRRRLGCYDHQPSRCICQLGIRGGKARRDTPVIHRMLWLDPAAGLRDGLYLFSLRTGPWRGRQSSSRVNEKWATPPHIGRRPIRPKLIGSNGRTRSEHRPSARRAHREKLDGPALVADRASSPSCDWRGNLPRVDDTGLFASFTGDFRAGQMPLSAMSRTKT
jgi:hypothetical protein